VQPSEAACIIETDCNVDFEAPVGYVEPGREGGREGGKAGGGASATNGGVITARPLSAKGGYTADHEAAAAAAAKRQSSFLGSGQRLDGKTPAGGKGASKEGDSLGTSGTSSLSCSQGDGAKGADTDQPPQILGRTISGRAPSTLGRGLSSTSQPLGGESVGSSLSDSITSPGSVSTSASSATAAGAHKKPALTKYSSKKGFQSFVGEGNKLS
jgi:hypothetical protein